MTISYPQFIGAMFVIALVVLIGYLVLVVAGQREVAELREKISMVGTAEMAHLQEAEIHIARITKLEAQVEGLMTQPQARKDPFTGTEVDGRGWGGDGVEHPTIVTERMDSN